MHICSLETLDQAVTTQLCGRMHFTTFGRRIMYNYGFVIKLYSVLTVSLERSEYTVSEGVDVTAAVLLEGVTAVNVSVYLTTIDSGNATGGGNSVTNFLYIALIYTPWEKKIQFLLCSQISEVV